MRDHSSPGAIRPVKLALDKPDGDILVVSVRNEVYRIRISRDVLFVNRGSESSVSLAAMIPNTCITRATGCGLIRKNTTTDRVLVRFSWLFSDRETSDTFFIALRSASNIPVAPKYSAMVFINPVSGTGRALHSWTNRVRPLLEESGRFDIISTVVSKFPGHITELIQSVDIQNLDVIIAIGGDGLVNEIYNGIYLGFAERHREILSRLTVCPLPCGSGNGLSYSTLCASHDNIFTLNSALRQLIRFRTAKRDLGLVEFDGGSRIFSLTISWGLVADVDIGSEQLRCLGDARFGIYALMKIMKGKKYKCVLKMGNDPPEHLSEVNSVYASIVPVAGRTVILDPSKSMASGEISVFKFLRSSRMQLVRTLSELEKVRNHSKFVPDFLPDDVVSFELTPDPSTQGGAGIVVDGEPLTRGPITVTILPKVTNCLVD